VTVAQRPDSGKLFQEELASDPFWMVVGCMLVNRTHWRQVRPVLQRLMMRFEGPYGLLNSQYETVLEVIQPLGFQNRRTVTLLKFAKAWTVSRPRTASDLSKMPGCGQYAVHSWMIFIDRKFPQASEVSDGKLAWYLEQMT
jgi:endonuclease III